MSATLGNAGFARLTGGRADRTVAAALSVVIMMIPASGAVVFGVSVPVAFPFAVSVSAAFALITGLASRKDHDLSGRAALARRRPVDARQRLGHSRLGRRQGLGGHNL
jgi:hypothetical protein